MGNTYIKNISVFQDMENDKADKLFLIPFIKSDPKSLSVSSENGLTEENGNCLGQWIDGVLSFEGGFHIRLRLRKVRRMSKKNLGR